jgi:hypothetical protein
MNPLGGGEEQGRRSGGAWKDGVAPTASLNGMRQSEKAKVPQKLYPDFQGLKSPRISEHTFTHKHTHTSCTTSRGSGWRIHCGVKVTELSTNKQHTHSLDKSRACNVEVPRTERTKNSRTLPKFLLHILPGHILAR